MAEKRSRLKIRDDGLRDGGYGRWLHYSSRDPRSEKNSCPSEVFGFDGRYAKGIHIGHSTGGGEVVHYLARHGESRVAKAAIISAVPPLMLKTAANPTGQPKEVFDGLQAQLAANRAQFYYDVPAGPFYGYNRPGAKPSQGVIWNWWRQGMMGGTKAHYDGIVAFSQTDFTEDLQKVTVPVLVMHSEDDQIVPYVASGPLSAKLLRNSTFKIYKDFPHGMPTTEADTINADLLTFLKKSERVAA